MLSKALFPWLCWSTASDPKLDASHFFRPLLLLPASSKDAGLDISDQSYNHSRSCLPRGQTEEYVNILIGHITFILWIQMKTWEHNICGYIYKWAVFAWSMSKLKIQYVSFVTTSGIDEIPKSQIEKRKRNMESTSRVSRREKRNVEICFLVLKREFQGAGQALERRLQKCRLITSYFWLGRIRGPDDIKIEIQLKT